MAASCAGSGCRRRGVIWRWPGQAGRFSSRSSSRTSWSPCPWTAARRRPRRSETIPTTPPSRPAARSSATSSAIRSRSSIVVRSRRLLMPRRSRAAWRRAAVGSSWSPLPSVSSRSTTRTRLRRWEPHPPESGRRTSLPRAIEPGSPTPTATRFSASRSPGAPKLLSTTRVQGSPYGVAVDPRRARLWVALADRNELQEFDIDGASPRRLDSYPTVRQPDSVAVDTVTGAVVVAGRDAGVLEVIGGGRR